MWLGLEFQPPLRDFHNTIGSRHWKWRATFMRSLRDRGLEACGSRGTVAGCSRAENRFACIPYRHRNQTVPEGPRESSQPLQRRE